MPRTHLTCVRAAEHQTTGQVGLSRMFYGHSRRRTVAHLSRNFCGLIVPTGIHNLEIKRTPNRENKDRLQTGFVSGWPDRPSSRTPLRARPSCGVKCPVKPADD